MIEEYNEEFYKLVDELVEGIQAMEAEDKKKQLVADILTLLKKLSQTNVVADDDLVCIPFWLYKELLELFFKHNAIDKSAMMNEILKKLKKT